jgi:hypothetical protein
MQSTVALIAIALLGAPDSPVPHRTVRCRTGQSGAAPDSPVNYSGVRLEKPEGEELEVNPP